MKKIKIAFLVFFTLGLIFLIVSVFLAVAGYSGFLSRPHRPPRPPVSAPPYDL